MKNYLVLIVSFFTFPALAQTNIELIFKNKIDHISTLAWEPMVCEHPNGSIFVTGFRNNSDSPQLWKSADLGKTWETVEVGTTEDGAIGNSDVDLFIDAKGNIYLLSLTYTKRPEKSEDFDPSKMKGERITLGVSKDEGESWSWQTISEKEYDDRPWITATTNGTLQIIWNDGKGVHHVVSKDEGMTWIRKSDISNKGGSSFFARGYNGQLAVRVVPKSAAGSKIDEGVDLIKLSLDNGESWSDVELPGNRSWTWDLSRIPRWVEPLVWDKENRLYAIWSEEDELKLGITSDNGKSWQIHKILQSPDLLYYPYMEIGDEGILCTWVSGFDKDIKHHAALLTFEEHEIQTYVLAPQRLDIWRYVNENYQQTTAGEYFPIIQLSNGNFGMVTSIRNTKADRLGFTWWELVLNKF